MMSHVTVAGAVAGYPENRCWKLSNSLLAYFTVNSSDINLEIHECRSLKSARTILAGSLPLLAIRIVSLVTVTFLKPGVHTNDFAPIHGRRARIHTAPEEDNTSNQQSTPQFQSHLFQGSSLLQQDFPCLSIVH